MKTERRKEQPPYSHTILAVSLFALLWLLPDLFDALTREADEAWARVRASGVIRFVTEASYMPFEGVGGEGVFYGMDIDIAREVARRLGLRAEFINAGIDGLYDAVRVGQADAAISALPIDPARLEKWAYSRPYFEAGLVAVARSQITTNIDIDPAVNAGHYRAAVVLGSDGDAWLRFRQRRASEIERLEFGTAAEALRAVEDGRADVAIVDRVTALQWLNGFKFLRASSPLTSDPYAIAVWGDSVELKDAIDAALGSMAEDGTLGQIVEEWVGGQ